MEEGRRKRVVELLLSVDVHLSGVELQVLLEVHELAADEDAHVVVAEQDHVADLVRWVLAALLGPLHEEVVYLETTVLDLFLCFLCLCEDGASLRVVVTVYSLEIRLHILITLMDNPDHID